MTNTTLTAERLRCEGLTEPLGINTARPRLQWTVRGNVAVGGSQVVVATTAKALTSPDVWDSGQTDDLVSVEYGGPELTPDTEYHWAVRVFGHDGQPGPWSAPARFGTGLAEGWHGAQWIRLSGPADQHMRYRPSPQLRRDFTVEGEIVRARLHITALGLYRAYLNGRRVGDDELRPGWTEYETRVPYQTYDVTELVQNGANAIGAVLGDGWLVGCMPYSTRVRNREGAPPRLLACLTVETADGATQTIVSDGDWQAAFGPIRASDRYLGEIYDARFATPGWTEPGFDASNWNAVEVTEGNGAAIVAAGRPPVRVIEELPAKEITEPLLPGWVRVVDFGQNIVGWVRLKVPAQPGIEITIRHGEMLHPDGTLYTTNLWDSVMQTDTYVCSDEEGTWEPIFTMHGFRYVEISGLIGPLELEDITAVAITTDLDEVSELDTSSDMLTQLTSNILWTQRGNFVEVPTDCPQRAERMGWMGDAEFFAPTALYNTDAEAFFADWLVDIRASQSDEGAFPNIVPRDNVLALPQIGAPGWGDAGVILPWLHWTWYGDRRVLEGNYDAMTRWVDFLVGKSTDGLYDPDHAWGDWLAVPPDQYEATGKALLGTLYLAHSADLVSRAAVVLGRDDDATRYRDVFEQAAGAFVREFVSGEGEITGNTQTLYALALRFGVLPQDLHAEAVTRLVEDIEKRGCLTTGIMGTAHVLHALSENGHDDLAYRMVEREEYPSWGYSIRQGATTIWERWDGWTEHAGFQTPQMNSFNHYALGAVGAWLHQVAVGIAPLEPGFGKILFAPVPGGALDHVRGRLDSPAGLIESGWERSGTEVVYDITVPPAATGLVRLVKTGRITAPESARPVGDREFEVGPGAHRFVAKQDETP